MLSILGRVLIFRLIKLEGYVIVPNLGFGELHYSALANILKPNVFYKSSMSKIKTNSHGG
jgi:hypothetical protein